MAVFEPQDHVRALLWPELGTGEVLAVSKATPCNSIGARTARVRWPAANQTSTHAFAALAHTDLEVTQ